MTKKKKEKKRLKSNANKSVAENRQFLILQFIEFSVVLPDSGTSPLLTFFTITKGSKLGSTHKPHLLFFLPTARLNIPTIKQYWTPCRKLALGENRVWRLEWMASKQQQSTTHSFFYRPQKWTRTKLNEKYCQRNLFVYFFIITWYCRSKRLRCHFGGCLIAFKCIFFFRILWLSLLFLVHVVLSYKAANHWGWIEELKMIRGAVEGTLRGCEICWINITLARPVLALHLSCISKDNSRWCYANVSTN